jgi:hypothetical protein
VVIFSLLPFVRVSASTTDGTIDSTNKYAWGNNLGWVNFGTAGGNVHVTSAGLTGYAWSANYGWINLAPAQAGVSNTCTGALTGYGRGQNVGYVNFGGVSINASGKFAGTAVVSGGGGLGSLTFDCINCNVTTDWRYCSSGSGGGGSGGSGGGGGTGGGTGYFGTSTIPVATSPYTPPTGSYCDAQARIGDFNCDGRIDLIDLSIFLYYYGRADAGIARYDLNRNGIVDFPDISILMYHWTG